MSQPPLRTVVALWLALVGACACRPAPTPQAVAAAAPVPGAKVELEAGEILDRMLAAYAKARSYRDKGTVTKTWSGWLPHTTELKFETAFVRGQGFRFEYSEGARDRMVIWGDEKRAKTWWTVDDGKVEESTLSHALGGAFGVSGRSSGIIPRMLIPEQGRGDPMSGRDGVAVAAAEKLDGMECYRLTGKWGDADQELWIDRESYLLRRVRTVRVQGVKTVETVIGYEPKLDADILDGVFRFEPPK